MIPGLTGGRGCRKIRLAMAIRFREFFGPMAGLTVLFTGIAGCASSARLRTADTPTLTGAEIEPAQVKVYASHSIGREFVVVGPVVASADGGEDPTRAVGALREEAARLGAVAIVDLRLEIAYGFWSSAVRATGLGVR